MLFFEFTLFDQQKQFLRTEFLSCLPNTYLLHSMNLET